MGMDKKTSTNQAARKISKVAREPDVSAGTLSSRIEKLALEECDAVRRRDWSAARTVAQERAALQEARQKAAARRLL